MSLGVVEWEAGLAPGLRDALRSVMGADGATWQLPDAEVEESLAVVGQLRALLEVAEVALVREGISRGLPEPPRVQWRLSSPAEGFSVGWCG